ncbi:TetR/AcrR family transcriptional regulator [Kocuria tytonis]|uniref:TetR/AcrR family transcriptional regulator n=1 Tax=Kocuria tytonis TaxID=2054280 RepID=A0A495A5X6_9MICC|nr:TetR/AcrR family transcriptional regulator [Kocuria tytonis]RKQ34915.1 TetR/AcrR family transcriptional regulator [Kocuria tytonis]
MSTTTQKQAHHHGNLREALVEAGITLLESGDTFSLRAVARQVGVSQTAPYRHFPDRSHLEAAMATTGFVRLRRRLDGVLVDHEPSASVLTDLAVATVRFAAENPALYTLMFSRCCGSDDARLPAAHEVFDLLQRAAARHFPDVDTHHLATAGWTMTHGLASLHLSGQLRAGTPSELDDRVAGAFSAVLAAHL